MTRWYRAYEGTVTDAKLHEAAVVASVSRSVAIACWHALLEGCATAKCARFETTPRRIAVTLGEPIASIEALFAAFIELGMIADGEVVAWSRRQFDSDNSTERSRRHREAKRNGDATAMQRFATPPEAETEGEREPEKIICINNNTSATSPRAQREPEARPLAFPPDGGVTYSGPWAGIVRSNAKGHDPDVIASRFREWCRSRDPPIPFDHPRIADKFRAFATTHAQTNRLRGHG